MTVSSILGRASLSAAGLLVATTPAWAGSTERVSVGPHGRQGNGDSSGPAVSADGRYVAFQSAATNLVRGDRNDAQDVFVRDRKLGTTEIVSVSSRGVLGDDQSYSAAISADGRFVAFASAATNLVSDD